MALRDLSDVTEILVETLRLNIQQRIDPSITTLDVTTLPPERAAGSENTINLFLYHLVEDPERRNLPGNLSDLAPAATKPMTLVLHYILTTHHEVGTDYDSITQQRLMGYALKTFHDFAVIDDQSNVNGTLLMPRELRRGQNQLEISLRAVDPSDSVAFWSAETTATTRLSAYYDVRYVMLEPEPPRRLPGIVLSLGTFVVDIASPQLAGTRSILVFDLPSEAGGATQRIEAAPARVGPPVPGLTESNQMALLGSSLGIGRRREVLLSNPRWRVRAPALARVPVDPDLPGNVDWRITVGAGEIALSLGTTLDAALPAGGTVSLPVEPGIYSASVRVVKDDAIQFGRTREITDQSNQTSFAVIPRLDSVSVVNPVERRLRITLDSSVDLTPATGPGLPGELDILVAVNGEGYLRHDPADPGAVFAAGDFLPAGNQIDVLLGFDPTLTGLYPVRVIVEGAESQPFWLEVP